MLSVEVVHDSGQVVNVTLDTPWSKMILIKMLAILKEQMPSLPKPCSGTRHSALPLPLLELPELALTLVAKQVRIPRSHGHPMLAVSRSARDAALRAPSRITLTLKEPDSDYGPLGRFLQRACEKAAPGLSVVLNLGKDCHLPLLLQPALYSAVRLRNVHTLEITTQQSSHLSLLGGAMPCLKALHIHLRPEAAPVDGGFFNGLQLCSSLEKLELTDTSISPTAVQPAAAALATLTNLRAAFLHVSDSCDTNPAGLVEQLTCLTELGLWSNRPSNFDGMLTAAARNPGLDFLFVSAGVDTSPTADQAEHLLTSCPSLTFLSLLYSTISQDVLEVILTHGTKITTLKAFAIQSKISFADRPCSWKSLKVGGVEHYASVLYLAHLPLSGVTEFELRDDIQDRGLHLLSVFQLPFSSIDLDQVPQKLRQAAANLASCPAWRAKPDSFIQLLGDPAGPFVDTHTFSDQQRIQLLEALAPVGGPHVKRFRAAISGTVFQWGSAELRALGRSLNSSQLSKLTLDDCRLTVGFWAALEEVLPALGTLILGGDVTCSPIDITVFCCKRRQGHHLTLSLCTRLYEAVSGAELQASLLSQGIPHVEIHQLPAEGAE